MEKKKKQLKIFFKIDLILFELNEQKKIISVQNCWDFNQQRKCSYLLILSYFCLILTRLSSIAQLKIFVPSPWLANSISLSFDVAINKLKKMIGK